MVNSTKVEIQIADRDRCELQPRNAMGWKLRCGELQLSSLSAWNLLGDGLGKGFRQVTPVNAEVFVIAHEDANFRRLLDTTINTVDGRVLQGICKLLYPNAGVVLLKGADFICDVADFCRGHGERLFLLGSGEESNRNAVEALKRRYPGVQVSGFGPPISQSPFEDPCCGEIIERIHAFRPQHLGVCFGPRKQEFWIEQNQARLESCGVRRAYALGGTIDFLSGARPRAPEWMQLVGLEWFFRFLSEPRARFHRTLIQFKMPIYAARTKRGIAPLVSL